MTYQYPIGDFPPGHHYWPQEFQYPSFPAAQGWQCPVCGTVYAPTIPSCMKGHLVTRITTTAGPLPVVHEKRSHFGEDSCSCGRDWPCAGASASSIKSDEVGKAEEPSG
jgi:hypothetical protein